MHINNREKLNQNKMQNLENFHILLVRHFAPNNKTMYPRVRIHSDRFEQSVFIPYTNDAGEMSNPVTEAVKHLKSKGFDIVGQGELKDDYVLIVDMFKPLK